MTEGISSRWQLPPGPWATVLDGLCARFPAISREQWRDRMARGRVLDGAGTVLACDTPYRVGLELRYFREAVQEPQVPFRESVLHLDEHLLVADKPPFLPVTPSGPYVEQCLLRRLVRSTGNQALVPLHRIDRETSGLVLFSTQLATRAAYQSLFREQRITKLYHALAPALAGVAMPHRHASRLEPGEPFFRMREVEGEPNTETGIEVLERGQALWRYGLRPVTGRKHQLRVHMAALGAPLLNDRLYPQLRNEGPDDFEQPLGLLAKSLTFADPLSGERRYFESPRELLF